MERKVISQIMLTLLLISMLTFGFNIKPVKTDASLDDAPVVYVDPRVVETNPGEYFSINVSIAEVTDLASYGFRVKFPRGLLEIDEENITEGSFLLQGASTSFTAKVFSNYIDVGCITLPLTGVSGNGTLARATFRVRKPGNTTLDLYNVALLNSTAQVIDDWNKRDSPDDGYFYTTLPVGRYSYSPHPTDYPGHPIVNETITFNATESYDPDDPYDPSPGGIVSYSWDFGDNSTGTGLTINHTYSAPASYIVTLNVTDDDGESYLVDHPIIGATVAVQLHDIAVINVTVTPSEVSHGGSFSINMTVLNRGSDTENLNVTAYANMHPVATKLFEYTVLGPPPFYVPQQYTSLESSENATTTIIWDTTGFPAGTYALSVEAFLVRMIGGKWQSVPELEREEDMNENTFTDGTVTIVEPPNHDLAITNIGVYPTDLNIDEWCTIEVTIVNEGNTDELFNATLGIEYESELTVLKPAGWSNQTLRAGTTARLDHSWIKGSETTEEGLYNITARVVLVNTTTLEEVADNDPTDNTRSTLADIRLFPMAHFTYSPTTPVIEQTVTFNATGSYAPGVPGGTIEQYAWDFDDGIITTTSTSVISHVYSTPETYRVTLTVTDDEGLNASKSADIEVSKGHPVASFAYSPAEPWVNETVTFDASASYDLDGTIVSYEWDFGDETTGTSEAVTHTYNKAGSFSVTLTVTDDDGLTDTTTAKLTVSPPTRVYVDPSNVYAPPSEHFTVDIRVADVDDLHTWQVSLHFDASVLSFVNVTEGDFLRKGGRETLGCAYLDEVEEGYALFAWAIKGMFWESGSGTLVTVEFLVLERGESTIIIDDPDTFLIKMNPPPIPPGGKEYELIRCIKENGYFTSVPTIDSLISVIKEFSDLGDIDNRGVKMSLLSKLCAAKMKMETGKTNTAKNILRAFLNQVNAQPGKHITKEATDILIESAKYIIFNL